MFEYPPEGQEHTYGISPVVKIKGDPLRRLLFASRPPLVRVAKRPAVLTGIALVVRDEGDEGVDGCRPERQLQEQSCGTPHDELPTPQQASPLPHRQSRRGGGGTRLLQQRWLGNPWGPGIGGSRFEVGCSGGCSEHVDVRESERARVWSGPSDWRRVPDSGTKNY